MTMFYLLEEYEDELLWSGDIFRVFIQNKGENYYTDRVVDFRSEEHTSELQSQR